MGRPASRQPGEEDRQAVMRAEREEAEFRAVVGGRQAVGAETDPREKRDQQNMPPCLGREWVTGRTEDDSAPRREAEIF